MADMVRMPALKVSHPVTAFILVITDNPSLQRAA
jgi:hypothetical protein